MTKTEKLLADVVDLAVHVPPPSFIIQDPTVVPPLTLIPPLQVMLLLLRVVFVVWLPEYIWLHLLMVIADFGHN